MNAIKNAIMEIETEIGRLIKARDVLRGLAEPDKLVEVPKEVLPAKRRLFSMPKVIASPREPKASEPKRPRVPREAPSGRGFYPAWKKIRDWLEKQSDPKTPAEIRAALPDVPASSIYQSLSDKLGDVFVQPINGRYKVIPGEESE